MKTDMSPNAITMRLKKTSELRKLCIALGGDRLKEKLKLPKVEQTDSAERIHARDLRG
ncbi:MAG: hypothetical protein HOD92_06135 [Deltaproteobacteria bacterium]|jgi:hypothetical protein|nr:hypothetical protein [Deltaproteobacteria bacterium]